MLSNCLLVALGGAVGCVARYLVSAASLALFGTGFPIGTLFVNVVGCLLIGVLGRLAIGVDSFAEPWRIVLVVGFLGGLTTFSSFGLETIVLIQTEHWGRAAAYVLASNIFGLAAVWIAWRATSSLVAG